MAKEYRIEIDEYVNEEVELDPYLLKLLEKTAAEKNRTLSEVLNDILKFSITERIEFSELSEEHLNEPHILCLDGKPVAYLTPIRAVEV